jgi:hypothetical protein
MDLKEVKEDFLLGSMFGKSWISTPKDNFDWLLQQAELLEEIANSWVAIETNGTSEDADNFYSVVQDILTKQHKD